LLDNINLAADMGAEVVWLKSPGVIKALIEFAQDKKITRIVVGQTHLGLWNRIFRRSHTSLLLSEARDFDVEVVAQERITTKS
jgi:K+-sensing histidine kinase KdpD